MELCEACGTENRSKARYCLGCARPLVPKEAAAEQGGEDTGKLKKSLRKSRRWVEGAPLPEADAASLPSDPKKFVRSPLLFVLLIAVVAVGAWMFGAFDRSSSSGGLPSAATGSAQPANATTPPAANTLVGVPALNSLPSELPAADSLSSKETLIEPSQKDLLAEAVQREERRAERARKMLERSAQEEKEAQARADRAAQRQRADEARRSALALDAPAPVPTDSQAQAGESVPAAAARKVSVEQACSNTSNFLSRDLCRIDACEKASNAKDPICVWYRQLDAERKRKQSQF